MKNLYKNKAIIILLMIFYFKPICFQYYSSLSIIENVFVYGKIIVSGIILLFILTDFFYNLNKIKVNKYLSVVFAFEVWMLVITIYNGGDVFRSVIDCVTIVVLSIYVFYGIKTNYRLFLRAIRNLLFVLVIIQMISAIIYPQGMPADLYKNNEFNKLFFYAIDNGTTGVLLGCISINSFMNYCDGKISNRIYNIILNIFCVLTAVLVNSSTAMICSILLLILIWLESLNEVWILNKRWFWIILYSLTFIIMMFLSSGSNAFTGRALLWTKSLDMIKIHPIIGYGKQATDLISVWGSYYSSHNAILQILLEGGIIGLVLWIRCIIKGIGTVRYVENQKLKMIMFFSVYVLLVSLLMEALVHSIMLFLILSITATLPFVCKK